MGLLDEVKDVAALAQAYGKLDLYQKVVDLQGAVGQLSQEKFELQMKVRELEAQINRQQSVQPSNSPEPFFFVAHTHICPLCWQRDSKIINVIGKNDYMKCPACDTAYHKTSEGHWLAGEPPFYGYGCLHEAVQK